MQEQGTAEKRYKDLEIERRVYLDRARKCAEVTIPALMPPEGSDSTTEYPTPYQSVGAEGVNNLSSKLLLALFPPSTPFYKFEMEESTIQQAEEINPQFRIELEQSLSRYEMAIKKNIERSGDRPVLFQVIKQLIVSGNVLLYIPEKGKARAIKLDRYVVDRDPQGDILEIIMKESVGLKTLDQSIIDQLPNADDDSRKIVDIYTHITREGDTLKYHQEIQGVIIKDTESTVPLDKSPFIPLRASKIDGENYGLSICYEYYGDLKAVDGLSSNLLDAAANAAKIIGVVNPNSTLDIADLAGANNGDYIVGEPTAVALLQSGKVSDFQFVSLQTQEIIRRLQRVFLLFAGAQRDAERVTSTEIREVAAELEDGLGGFYSLLSEELQQPYLKRRMFVMIKNNTIPALPEDVVDPVIITGLEALGRSQELQKIEALIGFSERIYGASMSEISYPDAFMAKIGSALQYPTEGLFKSNEVIQEEKQLLAQQQMEQAMAPEMIRQGGNLIQEGVKQSGNIEASS